ncbi:nucleolar MIF4G domain-containing protein 1-like isoform X2 [Orbicella faveolata]|uniref:nucleolar MIF4G domain-containing protein 1-like isoform X2 n=1 Tax=Orbicella faveolata TaxID=48498 RepID=UPI0009E560FE|nr:nucleolar MIF4G domain-containing protein 1-like isoform X2 [Orbicella faveolata]
MADPKGGKRKREIGDEFVHIRAKGQFLKVPITLEHDNKQDVTIRGKKTRIKPSRKDERRKARAEKKARKVAFFSRKKEQVSKVLFTATNKRQQESTNDSRRKHPDDKLAIVETKRSKQKRAKEGLKSQKITKQKLLADNSKEEKEIKKLEKLLKLGRKGKVLNSRFKMEGLDYLLEVCEPQMIENSKSDHGDDSMSEIESRPEPKKKAVRSKTEEHDMEFDGNDEQSISENEQEEHDVSYNDNNDVDDDDISSNNDNDKKEGYLNSEDETTTSIGFREESSNKYEHDNKDKGDHKQVEGNIHAGNMEKYIPPHLRNQTSSESHPEHINRVTCQIKGLLNRLSERNMAVISNEIENIFIHNSRNDMNKILSNLILGSCVSTSLMPEKLLMEHVMLLAILSSHIGTEVAAFFTERLAELFDHLHKSGRDSYGQGKECVNVVALFAHLYNFKIIHCCLIYDIIRWLVDSFTGQDVELLLLLLKITGAEIRRDDPASLKEIILQIQAKAASTPSLTNDSRVRFMLEIITNLRSNNLRKIPGYDPSKVEHLRKNLRSVIRESGHQVSIQLKISLAELLSAESKGRWWIVGSALSESHDNKSEGMSATQMENSKLLELARKQRMNTDVRKNVFLIMMTSEDYVDAFEKLLRQNLREVQTREVIHVLVDCCVQKLIESKSYRQGRVQLSGNKERAYNPYYAYLGQKFCEYNRSYQVTFQYSFWDKFKVVGNLAPHSVVNLSLLIAHLIATRALSLAILKNVYCPIAT